MERILFVTSEYYPLVKTGGLADVSAGLTHALREKGNEVNVLLPGYPQVLAQLKDRRIIATFTVNVGHKQSVTLMEGQVHSSESVWVAHCPAFFDRPGGPYLDESKTDWPDNWLRFALLCRVAEAIALGHGFNQWRPTVVHCNDWHAGLIPALLSQYAERPATVMTIHNLAYQGVFGYDAFQQLKLPAHWWSFDKLEFYGNFSFLKAGIVFADFITTVSPTYANEIITSEFGYGMEGVLAYHQPRLQGILNGVDYTQWNPASDPYIPHPYQQDSLERKAANKLAFQQSVGLSPDGSSPLVGVVSRLVHQKGMDLLPALIEQTLHKPTAGHELQWAVLGSGESYIETALQALAQKYPDRVSVQIGYDESMAHQVEAAADLFLMPSRYEPCGLNQIYSLKYGTLPIVRKTGGLADTVVDATPNAIELGTATGVQFEQCDIPSITHALARAVTLYEDKNLLKALRRAAMSQSFGWAHSAAEYQAIYRYVAKHRHREV